MVFLQNYDTYDEVAQFDPQTGKLDLFSREKSVDLPSETDGCFSSLDGDFASIFRHDDRIMAVIGNFSICLDDQVSIEVEGPPSERVLMVSRGESELFRRKYALDLSLQIPLDPTPFQDEESFDFGLWMSNISKSRERQAIFFEKPVED